jgi:hypothetical protein
MTKYRDLAGYPRSLAFEDLGDHEPKSVILHPGKELM